MLVGNRLARSQKKGQGGYDHRHATGQQFPQAAKGFDGVLDRTHRILFRKRKDGKKEKTGG